MNEYVSRKHKAYILVRVHPGKELDFFKELKETSHIVAMDLVRGPYDFIVVVEGNEKEVDSIIFKIRKLPYILGTETMMAFEAFPWEDISGHIDYDEF